MAAKTFPRTVIADIKRALRFPILIAILVVILSFILDNYGDLLVAFENPERAKEVISVFYYYFNAVSFGGMFTRYLFVLIAAVPFGAQYARERQSGMTVFLIHRSGQRNYCISKMLTAALTGGLALCLGSLIFVAGLSTRLQLIVPLNLTEFVWLPYCSLLSSGGGVPYFAAALYLMFLTGALWASVAMCVSAFTSDPYVVIASPFLISFLQMQFSRLLKLPDTARLELLLCGRAQWGSDSVSLFLIGLVIALIWVGLTFIFYCRVKRRVQDGLC